jgi:hypothetical protein
MMRTGDISKILSKEWNAMEMVSPLWPNVLKSYYGLCS